MYGEEDQGAIYMLFVPQTDPVLELGAPPRWAPRGRDGGSGDRRHAGLMLRQGIAGHREAPCRAHEARRQLKGRLGRAGNQGPRSRTAGSEPRSRRFGCRREERDDFELKPETQFEVLVTRFKF